MNDQKDCNKPHNNIKIKLKLKHNVTPINENIELNYDLYHITKEIIRSKGSEIAKSGYIAEDLFRSDLKIRSSLELYFKFNIIEMIKVNSKKYDTAIILNTKTIPIQINIQNKKIVNLGGRGDSFDRRHIKDTFNNMFIRKYLTLLTLVRECNTKTTMTLNQKTDFIKLCNANLDEIKQYLFKTLIGNTNENNINEYWCIMKQNNLYIISSIKLYNFLCDTMFIDIKMKSNGTCLHLSPNVALQRKGGGTSDKNPNHIQAKLKITQNILDLCYKLI